MNMKDKILSKMSGYCGGLTANDLIALPSNQLHQMTDMISVELAVSYEEVSKILEDMRPQTRDSVNYRSVHPSEHCWNCAHSTCTYNGDLDNPPEFKCHKVTDSPCHEGSICDLWKAKADAPITLDKYRAEYAEMRDCLSLRNEDWEQVQRVVRAAWDDDYHYFVIDDCAMLFSDNGGETILDLVTYNHCNTVEEMLKGLYDEWFGI